MFHCCFNRQVLLTSHADIKMCCNLRLNALTTMGKCKFSKEWLCDPKYKDWLARDSKWAMKAKCTLCVKSFDISNMGETAVVCQNQGKKKTLSFCHCVFCTESRHLFASTQIDSKSAYSVGDLLKRQLKNLIKA